MWEFIHDFIRAVFDPLFYCMVVGMVFAAMFYRKERGWLFITFGVMLLFLMWRYMLNVQTSRYFGIFIVPAILFSVALCYCRIFPIWLSRLGALAIFIICFIQAIHFNIYATYWYDACKLINRDAGSVNARVINLLADGRQGQLEYYIDYKHEVVAYGLPRIAGKATPIVQSFLINSTEVNETSYIVVRYAATERDDLLRYIEGVPGLTLLSNVPGDRRKRDYLAVLRFLRPAGFGELSALPEAIGDYPRWRDPGIDEKLTDPQKIKWQMEQFDISSDTAIEFPRYWISSKSGSEQSGEGSIRLSDEHGNGDYSLAFASVPRRYAYNTQYLPAGDHVVSFSGRATPGSKIGIAVVPWKSRSHAAKAVMVARYDIESGESFTKEVFIPEAAIGGEPEFRVGVFCENGEIILNEFSVRRVDASML